MSFKKLLIPAAAVAVTILGWHIPAAGASPLFPDANITAGQVRGMIAHRAYADVRGMTPGVAEITKDEIRITSAECGDKGNPTSDWQSLYIGRVKDGRVTQGDLCDGRTRSKTVPFPYTYFFTSKMNSIAQRVVLSIKVRWWLFGATESISSDGRVATLKFKDYTGPDRPAHPVKELRIVGSEARVQARY